MNSLCILYYFLMAMPVGLNSGDVMGSNFSSMLAYRGTLYETPSCPAQPANNVSQKRLEVTVLFKGVQHTIRALKTAGELAQGLDARIRLVVPQVVPCPLQLESSPIPLEFRERRFLVLAATQAIETRVEIYLCRELEVVLAEAVGPQSTVVIAARRRWWPTSEECLAKRLCRQGHEVIFASEDSKGERVYA
jgi:hypothetical protein